MPSTQSFYQWLDARPEWQKRYTIANEARQELLFDEMWDIAQNTEMGEEITTSLKDTKMVVKDMTSHRSLKINTLQWMLSRMNPTKYGNRIEVDGKMDNKIEPIQFNIIRSTINNDSDDKI
jgi:hypothetical protein